MQKNLEPVLAVIVSGIWDYMSNLIADPCAVLARGLCALACAARTICEPQVSQLGAVLGSSS